jgi:hypothetical protein
MPISCSILNQIRQFQQPWVQPLLVYNFSFNSEIIQVEGLAAKSSKPLCLCLSTYLPYLPTNDHN